MCSGGRYDDDDHTWFTGDNAMGEYTWQTRCRVDVAEHGQRVCVRELWHRRTTRARPLGLHAPCRLLRGHRGHSDLGGPPDVRRGLRRGGRRRGRPCPAPRRNEGVGRDRHARRRSRISKRKPNERCSGRFPAVRTEPAGDFDYGPVGTVYSSRRRADPRIAVLIRSGARGCAHRPERRRRGRFLRARGPSCAGR